MCGWIQLMEFSDGKASRKKIVLEGWWREKTENWIAKKICMWSQGHSCKEPHDIYTSKKLCKYFLQYMYDFIGTNACLNIHLWYAFGYWW